MINIALEYDEVIENVKQKNRDQEAGYIQRTLEAKKKQRKKYLKSAAELYTDWKNEEITHEEYKNIRADLNGKLQKLDATITNLEQTQAQLNDEDSAENGFAEHFMKYRNIDALTRPMLIELIDKILIHEDGKITIKVKFADAFEAMLDCIETQNEVA